MYWLAKWSIRTRLLMAFLSVLSLSGVLIFFSMQSIQSITFFKSINEKLETLELNLTIEELAVKEFIHEGYKTSDFHTKNISPQIDHFNASSQNCKEILSFLKKNSSATQWADLMNTQQSIRNEFDSLTQLLKLRGFKDFGLEGSLRKAVHEVEDSKTKYDKTLLLTLRRNEKDFFLRKDLKYQKDFVKNLDLFKESVSGNTPLVQLAEKYGQEFGRVVALDQIIGLTENSGIRGRLKENLERSRPLLIQVKTEIISANGSAMMKSQSTLILMFILQIALGITLAISYSNIVSRSIKSIRDSMTSLAAGKFPDKLKVVSSEEIGQTKVALNQMVDRVRSAVEFSTALGSGNFNINYNEAFKQDVLAISLVQMQGKIREADEKQLRTNWVNEGLAQIAEITQNERQGLQELGQAILAFLIRYVGAQQGVLYATDGNKLEAAARYGATSNTNKEDILEFGEGLVGQCAKDCTTINLTEVPNHYFKISSGLGSAVPKNMILIPLLLEKKCFGVLEVASLEIIPSYRTTFLERAAEMVALLMYNRQTSAVTDRLLKEATEKTHVLQQQEEEMRQNMEELVAVQEQLRRRSEESETRMRLLNEADIGILEFNRQGLILSANESLLKMTGYTEREFVGKEVALFLQTQVDQPPLHIQLARSAAKNLELKQISKTGRSRRVRGSFTTITNEAGEIQRIVAILVESTYELQDAAAATSISQTA
jgi:PAS domain S-box-containing protein